MRKKLAILSMFVAPTLLSCIGPLTEVWVVVESNIPIAPPAVVNMGLGQVRVHASVGGVEFWNTPYSLQDGAHALPGHFVIRPVNSGESRPVELVVEGLKGDGSALVSQRALFTFARGRRTLLRVYLAAECQEPRQSECAAMGLTCGRGGMCITPDRGELPEYTPANLSDDGGLPADGSGSGTIVAPQILRPTSGSVMSSRRPAIRWKNAPGATGARIELFRDRRCTLPVDLRIAGQMAAEVQGTEFRPVSDLPTGPVFFRLTALVNAQVTTMTSPVWQMRIPTTVTNAAVADTTVRIDPDFNGDGVSDIAFDSTSGGMRTMKIIFGSSAGMPQSSTPIPATGSPNLLGDINGDGLVDLGLNTANGLQVFFGNADPTMILQGGMLVPWPTGAASVTNSVSPAFDPDGDGYADFLVGAPSLAVNGMNSAGQAYLFRGGASVPTEVGLARGTQALDQLGMGLTAGDMDGDGITEFLLSSPFATAQRSGLVQVIHYSSMTRMLASFGQLGLAPTTFNAHTGRIIACMGDNNGDGRADLLVNANEYTSGGAAVGAVGWLSGTASMPGPGIPRLVLGTATQNVGQTIAQLGDINGDGFGDLAIARARGTGAMPVPSDVLIYRGAAMGPPIVVAPNFIVGDLATMTVAGAQIAGVGDVNGDGFDDFVCTLAGPAPAMGSLRLFSGGAVFPLMNTPIGDGVINGIAASN